MKDHLVSKCALLADMVAARILDSENFKLMMREMVLSVVVEQDRIAKQGMARAFLAYCSASGIKVTLKGGRLFADRKLDQQLQGTADLYRPEIIDYLKRQEATKCNGHVNGRKTG